MSTPTTTRPQRVDFSDPGPRRRRRIRLAVVAGVALISVGVVWLVWFSAVLQVREVRVVGVEGARAEEARAVASVPVGIPLARIDAASSEERLRALPWVASAEVRRGWPNEVVIAVTGREAVAALADEPRRQAIDDQGVVFTSSEELPRKLPRIRAEGAALSAAVAVLQSLPPDLRDRVVSLRATTRDDVDLILRSGDEVRWGSADQAEMKAEVLRVLLKRKADMYDVSAPELPTTFRLG